MKKLLVKAKGFLKDHKKLMTMAMAVMCVACMFAVPASAEAATVAEGETVSWSSFSGVLSGLTSQINVTSILAIVAGLVGAAVGLAFMWWGVRKLISVIMKAFKKGKVSV